MTFRKTYNRAVRRSRRSLPQYAHPSLPEEIIDSDVDDASLSSSLCNDYVDNIASEMDPSEPPFVPITRPTKPSAKFIPKPRKHTPYYRESDPKQDLQYVIEEALSAYRHFQENSNPGTEYCCVPMPNAKLRLAVHRASEVLGADSVSVADGPDRHIVMTWREDSHCDLTEEQFLDRVKAIFSELFPPWPRVHRHPDPEKYKRKMQARANYVRRRDALPEQVEHRVEQGDWDGLDKLFEGMPFPVSGGRNKKAKGVVNAPNGHHNGWTSNRNFSGRNGSASYVRGHQSGKMRGGKGRNGAGARGGKQRPAQPIDESNKGFKMLANMGWQEGQGLGAEAHGRLEPIAPQVRPDRAGLGSRHANHM